jgi:hypothetical protein
MWWLKHPELILCNRCRKAQAEACVKGRFDNWLGSAEDGDFLCLECANKINIPLERLIVKRSAIDAPSPSAYIQ